jgi:hypothetical protein
LADAQCRAARRGLDCAAWPTRLPVGMIGSSFHDVSVSGIGRLVHYSPQKPLRRGSSGICITCICCEVFERRRSSRGVQFWRIRSVISRIISGEGELSGFGARLRRRERLRGRSIMFVFPVVYFVPFTAIFRLRTACDPAAATRDCMQRSSRNRRGSKYHAGLELQGEKMDGEGGLPSADCRSSNASTARLTTC